MRPQIKPKAFPRKSVFALKEHNHFFLTEIIPRHEMRFWTTSDFPAGVKNSISSSPAREAGYCSHSPYTDVVVVLASLLSVPSPALHLSKALQLLAPLPRLVMEPETPFCCQNLLCNQPHHHPAYRPLSFLSFLYLLSLSLSLSFSVSLFSFLSVSLSLSLFCLSVSVFVSLSPYSLSLCLSVSLSASVSLSLTLSFWAT